MGFFVVFLFFLFLGFFKCFKFIYFLLFSLGFFKLFIYLVICVCLCFVTLNLFNVVNVDPKYLHSLENIHRKIKYITIKALIYLLTIYSSANWLLVTLRQLYRCLMDLYRNTDSTPGNLSKATNDFLSSGSSAAIYRVVLSSILTTY